MLITAASMKLLLAFAVHDFTRRYVCDNSSRAMPLYIVMAAFYSGQQGSLLFWAWSLANLKLHGCSAVFFVRPNGPLPKVLLTASNARRGSLSAVSMSAACPAPSARLPSVGTLSISRRE